MSDISFSVLKGNKSGSLESHTTTRPALKGDQVHVRVTASGVCGTDLHYLKAGIVLGHEGVGVVEAIGPDVKNLKKGDRVGWGYEHDSCGHCHQCLTGTETYCPERQMYASADLDQGSFGTAAVWREAFLFTIPEGLSDVDAAPLMCGGATVFEALYSYPIQPTDRVGIVGVGGLGHLAIQFAAKMGCDVVVFSGSEAKKEEALKLGATEFHAMSKEKDLKGTTAPIDRLLVTSSAQPDWSQLLPVLAPGAYVFPLSVASGDFAIPYMPMLATGLRIQGSIVAPRAVHQRMLQFAARHKIAPITETFDLTVEGAKQALEKLDAGKMRYRGVLLPREGAKL